MARFTEPFSFSIGLDARFDGKEWEVEANYWDSSELEGFGESASESFSEALEQSMLNTVGSIQGNVLENALKNIEEVEKEQQQVFPLDEEVKELRSELQEIKEQNARLEHRISELIAQQFAEKADVKNIPIEEEKNKTVDLEELNHLLKKILFY